MTEVQKKIIREVCSLQQSSLVNILIKVDLGFNPDGEKWDDIWKESNISRKEFDDELFILMKRFKDIEKNTELVFELKGLDLLVLKHILFHFEYKWENRYPNALANLWNKIVNISLKSEIMKRIKIEGSSNIDQIGYDDEQKLLEVKFHNGRTYTYWPVTKEGWELFYKAESKGKFFNTHFRTNKSLKVNEV